MPLPPRHLLVDLPTMAEEGSSTVPPKPATFSSSQTSARPSQSPLRHRPPGRASNFSEGPGPLNNRRNSTLSDSISEARRSIYSSTDDLLLPKVRNSGTEISHEPSHWHSVPLALALLPAVGGLLFQNGSAVMTDVTLLGLAAVFLNWSVRLPWDWYSSAQLRRLPGAKTPDPSDADSAVLEESGSSNPTSPAVSPSAEPKDPTPTSTASKSPSPAQKSATTELRIHELLALLACFLSPLMGAWLLHTIRGQLSRPSEGLVSDYNLTIFLLASELRPLSHLIKLVQARTLYLQRTLAPTSSECELSNSAARISDLAKRLDELEAHVVDTSSSASKPTKGDITQLTTLVRQSFQPDLDALNRAVRRYEKRATLLTIHTESRLQELESRMSDAITLAAAAERSNQTRSRRSSSASILLDWACAAIVLPVQAAWTIIGLPARLATAALGLIEGYVGRKVKRELRTAGKTGSGSGHERRVGKERDGAKGRAGKKMA